MSAATPGAPGTTRVERLLAAEPDAVYGALIDAEAIACWRVPLGMSAHVHRFEAHEGGGFRVSLTYDLPGGQGKTTAHTDTYHGHFVRLVPDRLVVESLVFESDDPAMQGTMTVTTTLHACNGGGTRLVAVHEGLPPGVAPADNVRGWAEALDRLAALLERADDR